MSAPTGDPGPYGPLGPPVHPGEPTPSGHPVQPGPPGPYAPQLASAPVPPRSTTALVIAAVLLAVAVVAAATYLVGRLTASPTVSAASSVATAAHRSTGPSSATTSARRPGFSLDGSTLSGRGFTARMPSGWTLAADNGSSDTDGVIENGGDNSIAYFASDPTSATTRCFNAFESYRVKLGGTVVDLPSVRWANGTAIVKELETKYSNGQAIGLDIYCVDRPGNTSAAVLSIAAPDHQAASKAAAQALLASWTWT